MSQALDDAPVATVQRAVDRPARGRTMLVALFVPHGLLEMRSTLEYCLDAGWRLELLLGYRGGNAEKVVDWARDRGVTLRRVPDAYAYGDEGGSSVAPAWLRRLGTVPGKVLRTAWRLYDRVRNRRAALRWMADVVTEVRPDLLLTHNFRSAGRVDHAALRACRNAGIATACVMVSPMVSRKLSYMARVAHLHQGMCDPDLAVAHSLRNRIAARIWPDWVAWDGGVGVFDNHPLELLAARLSGLLPRDIWQVPPTDFDVVFTPTDRARERLAENGYPIDRLRSFGMPRMEEAARVTADQAAIDRLYRHLNLPAGTPFVLWNMEPSWEHDYSSAEVHWDRVENIRAMLERLGRPVIISLHPLCRRENYGFLEQTANIRISDDHGIHILYPFSAFSISYGCSTDQFGEAAGRTVLFYDWTGISEHPGRWAEFQVAGMRVARDFATLEKLIGDAAAETDWQAVRRATGRSSPTVQLIERCLAGLVDRVPAAEARP